MSNENKNEQVVEKQCLCQNEFVRKTFGIALGSFVGVFCALSLFAALHKPPMMPPHGMYGMAPHFGCPCQMNHHFMHKKHFMHKGFDRDNFIPQKPDIVNQKPDKD